MNKKYLLGFLFSTIIFSSFSFASDNLGQYKCKKYGGKVISKENVLGNAFHVCEFKDDSVCDLWAFYWGDCHLSQSKLNLTDKNKLDNIMEKVDKSLSKKSKSSQIALLKGVITNIEKALAKTSNTSLKRQLNYLLSAITVRYDQLSGNLVAQYKKKYMTTTTTSTITSSRGSSTTTTGGSNYTTGTVITTGTNLSGYNSYHFYFTGFELSTLDLIITDLETEFDRLKKTGIDYNLATSIGKSTLMKMSPTSDFGSYKIEDLLSIIVLQEDINYFKNLRVLKIYTDNDYLTFPGLIGNSILDDTVRSNYDKMVLSEMINEKDKLNIQLNSYKQQGNNLILARTLGYNNLVLFNQVSTLGSSTIADLVNALMVEAKIEYLTRKINN
ncbi:MAG: hypothetical protein V3575_00775 [Candidatus Absconditabacteria bacterium]